MTTTSFTNNFDWIQANKETYGYLICVNACNMNDYTRAYKTIIENYDFFDSRCKKRSLSEYMNNEVNRNHWKQELIKLNSARIAYLSR